MTWFGKRNPLTHLGTLHGSGSLLTRAGQELGPVTYEIDGYLDRTTRSANGQIEGVSAALSHAFDAGAATIVLAGGESIRVVVSDPHGGPTAEVEVVGSFPL